MSECCPIKPICSKIKKGRIPTSELGTFTKQAVNMISSYRAQAVLCLATNPRCFLHQRNLENVPADSGLATAFVEEINRALA